MPRRHHRLRPRPVLQHPRPDEVYEKGLRRGRCRRRRGDPAGAEPPGCVLQAAAGRAGDPAHPRRRPTAVRHLRGAGPGLCRRADARQRQRRHRAGGGLRHKAPGRARHPGPPAVLCQRAAGQEPAAVRRRGGGLPQPAAEGQVPRLRPAHHAAGERGGRQRPPGQDRGEIPVRQDRVRRGALHREGRAGPGGPARRRGEKALLPDHDGAGVPGDDSRSAGREAALRQRQTRRLRRSRPSHHQPFCARRADGADATPDSTARRCAAGRRMAGAGRRTGGREALHRPQRTGGRGLPHHAAGRAGG